MPDCRGGARGRDPLRGAAGARRRGLRVPRRSTRTAPRPCATRAAPPGGPRASSTRTARPSCTRSRSARPTRSALRESDTSCRSCRCSTPTPGACPTRRRWPARDQVFPGPRMTPADIAELIARSGVTPHRRRADDLAGHAPARPGARPLEPARGHGRRLGGARGLIRAFDERFGVPIIQGWGMTETSPLASIVAPAGDADELCRGRALRAARPARAASSRWSTSASTRRRAASCRSAGRSSRATTTTIRPRARSSPRTAGCARATSPSCATARYIHLVDRTKDLVKSGGEWISSVELENEIMAHADVLEAAVIAIPDEKWGERPCACVVLKPGAGLDPDGVREFLSGRVAKWWLPERVEFIDEVPKTSVGKFNKKVLRERFAGEQAAAPAPARDSSSSPTSISGAHRAPTCSAGPRCARRCWRRSPTSTAWCCWATCSSCATAPRARRWRRRARCSRTSARALGPRPRVVVVPRKPRPQLIAPWLEAAGAGPAPRRSGSSSAPATRPRRWPQRPGRVAGARAGRGRLSGPVAARRRLRTPRPLPRRHTRCRLRAHGRPRGRALVVRPLPDAAGPAEAYEALARADVRAALRVAQRARDGPGAAHAAHPTRLATCSQATAAARLRTRCSPSASRPRRGAEPARARAAAVRALAASRCAAPAGRDGRGLGRLDPPAAHVIFGHTHRSGPWPADTMASGRRPVAPACSTPARGSTSGCS